MLGSTKIIRVLITIAIVLIITPLLRQNVPASALPADAIRVRIVAHSDSAADQQLKRDVQAALAEQLAPMLEGHHAAVDTRRIVKQAQPVLQQRLQRLVAQRQPGQSLSVTFGTVEFPPKQFDGAPVAAGHYETLLVTIGAGEGHNWWCLLFPNICLAGDESDAARCGEQEQAAPHKSWLAQWISKLW